MTCGEKKTWSNIKKSQNMTMIVDSNQDILAKNQLLLKTTEIRKSFDNWYEEESLFS